MIVGVDADSEDKLEDAFQRAHSINGVEMAICIMSPVAGSELLLEEGGRLIVNSTMFMTPGQKVYGYYDVSDSLNSDGLVKGGDDTFVHMQEQLLRKMPDAQFAVMRCVVGEYNDG